MDIAILEDDFYDRIKIEKLITLYKNTLNIDLKADFFANGERFMQEGIHKHYHLILMDIYMGKTDGIETAKLIQNFHEDALVVYITDSDMDIWRAVQSHNCFDYIQKSDLTIERFKKLMDDVIIKRKLYEKAICFFNGKQEIKVKIHDIQYIISHDKYSSIIFKSNQERKFRITFSQLYDLLKENSFFILCNRGVLLNMNYIQQLSRDSFEMMDGNMFPLRRKDRREIVDRYNEYQFEKLESAKILA